MTADSMLTGFRIPQVRLIASYWIRFSLRTGGGLITLLLVLFVGLSVAGMFMAPVEEFMAKAPQEGHTEAEAADYVKQLAEQPEFSDLVSRVLGTDASATTYLLQGNPALLSVIFIVLLWLFPFIACVGSFNQTSSDIGSRGLRYLLLRTERPNILAGRFIGTVIALKVATALMFLITLLYIGLKFGVYPAGDLIVWGLQGYVAIVLLSLAYIALCTWISSIMDSPFASLALCVVLSGGSIILLKVLDANIRADLSWTNRLTPWGWKYDLLSGDVGTRVLAYLAMLAFTGVFLFLAFRSFHRRDL